MNMMTLVEKPWWTFAKDRSSETRVYGRCSDRRRAATQLRKRGARVFEYMDTHGPACMVSRLPRDPMFRILFGEVRQ